MPRLSVYEMSFSGPIKIPHHARKLPRGYKRAKLLGEKPCRGCGKLIDERAWRLNKHLCPKCWRKMINAPSPFRRDIGRAGAFLGREIEAGRQKATELRSGWELRGIKKV
jgi:hypothetical protein